MSQITTHVLDTSLGKPAAGITIRLQRPIADDEWEDIASGVTNEDGRIPGFMRDGDVLPPGIYRMLFITTDYFQSIHHIKGFYPYIPVVVEITNDSHHHIPLLLNPFGYSTYRGS